MKILLDSPIYQPETSSLIYFRQTLFGSNISWKNLGMEVGGDSESMKSTSINSCEVPRFVQMEINGEFLLFQLDTLYCAEPVKP